MVPKGEDETNPEVGPIHAADSVVIFFAIAKDHFLLIFSPGSKITNKETYFASVQNFQIQRFYQSRTNNGSSRTGREHRSRNIDINKMTPVCGQLFYSKERQMIIK